MIFPYLEIEDIVQVNDKTRLSAVKSFISKDNAAIDMVEIEPNTGDGFIEITGSGSEDWYLDWQYDSDGTKTISLRITDAADPTPNIVTFTKDIEIISSDDDKLWSVDSDLTSYEPDILQYVPAGRNSFLNIHRKAQKLILDWFDEQRIWDVNGDRLTKDSIIMTEDLNRMATTKVLELIFQGLSNEPEDVFDLKSKSYASKFDVASARGRIRYDFNNDAEQAPSENLDNKSMMIFRRG